MVIKKLIAISVVFALVAGTAFAVDLTGQVFGGARIAEKIGTGKAELFNGGVGRVRLEGSGEADVGIGTIGGWLRYDAGGSAAGLAWWQPIDALRVQLGGNPDGHFDVSHVIRYGYHGWGNDVPGLVGFSGNNGMWETGPAKYDNAVFTGAFGSGHFGLIITPMEALTINVGIPLNTTATGTDTQAAATFKSALFQVNYTAGFGAIHITYRGNGGGSSLGTFFASAYLTVVENLEIEFGAGFSIPANNAAKAPLTFGLGAAYNAGSFGVKFRSVFDIPMESGDKVAVRVGVLPSFAINDSVTVFGDIGILMYNATGTSVFQWHFNPYVEIGPRWGAQFIAGLHFEGANGGGGVSWGVPIGILITF